MDKHKQKTYQVRNEDELRAAIAQRGPRTITFAPDTQVNNLVDGMGIVILAAKHRNIVIEADEGNVVIDGTGPTPVNIVGCTLLLNGCKNVTLRNLHLRRGATGFKALGGAENKDKSVGESLLLERAENVLIENCTCTWGTDETVTIIDCKNVIMQRCFLAHGLDFPKDVRGRPLHYEKQPHAYGMLICASENVLIEECVFAHFRRRSPSISGDGKLPLSVTVRACLVHNYGEHGTNFNDGNAKQNKRAPAIYNVHDNFYMKGPNTIASCPTISIERPRDDYALQLHCAQNNQPGPGITPDRVEPVFEKMDKNTGRLIVLPQEPRPDYEAPRTLDVWADAGATPWDAYDLEIRQGISDCTGRFINHERETCAYKLIYRHH